MARKKKTRGPAETLTRFAVKVEGYDAWSEASIHPHVRQPEYSFHYHDNDPLFEHVTRLRVWGTSTYPPERSEQQYEITLLGSDAPSAGLSVKVKDSQDRDEDGLRKYRKYRGRDIPVYRPPSGYGLLNKVRGESKWHGWVTVAPRLITDWLVLLASGRDLYLEVAERKTGRSRWIEGIGLQTADPAEE